MAEARELNHSYVGTEHLLFGLLREEQGIAAGVLNEQGVTLERTRQGTRSADVQFGFRGIVSAFFTPSCLRVFV